MSVIEESIFADNDEEIVSQGETFNSINYKNDQDFKRLEGPNPWNRLGLSTLASPALRSLLKTTGVGCSDVQAVNRIHDQDQVNYHRNYLKEANVVDTFLSYKWILEALLRRTAGNEAGCQIKIADVLLFEAGEPKVWIHTNKAGYVKSRMFRCESMLCWERFLKVAFQASGTSKEDLENPICTKYSWGIEGVLGEHLNAQEFREFARTDPMNRFQVAGVQIIVGPKCGMSKIASRKAIVYKAEFSRRGSKGSMIKHTKEYDVQQLAWDTHMSNVTGRATGLSASAGRGSKATKSVPARDVSPARDNQIDEVQSGRLQNMHNVSVAPWRVLKEVLPSKSLNRGELNALTMKVLKYVERSKGLELENLRCHFVMDFNDRIWLVGASRVLPGHASPDAPQIHSEAHEQDEDLSKQARSEEASKSFDDHANCLEAIRAAPELRKGKQVQTLFDFIQGCHFFANFPSIFLHGICRNIRHKFIEQAVEVYYAGDICDEMYVIISGSVRVLQEPFNTTYCRTVDLCRKDVFGEQAITRPGSKMLSQVLATEDTHLIAISRQDVESVLNMGKPNGNRWKIKKSHLERCRKVFTLSPQERTISDLKSAVACCPHTSFFQNIPDRVHYDLCRVAHHREFRKGQILFDLDLKQPEVSEKSSLMFYVILIGEILWKHKDGNEEWKETTVASGDHILSVGTAVVLSENQCQVLVIRVSDWERIAKDVIPTANVATLKDPAAQAEEGIFLTQVEFNEANTEKPPRKSEKKSVLARSFNPLQHPDQQKERHLTCSVTGEKFPASKQQCLRWRQIRETALHLQTRQVHLPGFDRKIWHSEPTCRLRFEDSLVVSPYAYSVYVAEKNLQDQEKLFASILVHGVAPRMMDRVLPPAGCNKATTRLLLCGMFIELSDIESPQFLATFGTRFELHFKLCEETSHVAFELLPDSLVMGNGALCVNQVRLLWFFCADEGMNIYLKERGNIDFTLQECTRNVPVATFAIDLSEVADKVVLHQSFRMAINAMDQKTLQRDGLQFVRFNMNVGCIRFREVNAANMRLKRRHGLYFPQSPFISETLPCDGWDPCNEDYIERLIEGYVDHDAGAVLSADGRLIPRGRLAQQLMAQDKNKSIVGMRQGGMATSGLQSESSDGKDKTSLRVPVWKRASTGPARTVRALRNVSRNEGRPMSAPPRFAITPAAQDHNLVGHGRRRSSDATSSSCNGSQEALGETDQCLLSRSNGLKRRPASALGHGTQMHSSGSKLGRPESAPPDRRQSRCEEDKRASSEWSKQVATSKLEVHHNAHQCLNKGGNQDGCMGAADYAMGDRVSCASDCSRVKASTSARPASAMSHYSTRQRPLSATNASRVSTRPASATSSMWTRPASGMSGISTTREHQDSKRYTASLVATMTRPASALETPGPKCLQGVGYNEVPSLVPAWEVSKMLSVAAPCGGTGAKAHELMSALETRHKAWRSKLIPVSLLDQDLKSLQTRTDLVSIRQPN